MVSSVNAYTARHDADASKLSRRRRSVDADRVWALPSLQSQRGPQTKPDYPIKPVPFTAVHLNDEFWAPRIEINRTASIPSAFEQCELTGRVEAVRARRRGAARRRRTSTSVRPAIRSTKPISTR